MPMRGSTAGVSQVGGGRPWEAAPTTESTESHPAGGLTEA